ncbi:MAG: DUF2164 family protein [Proteobacteria bacterium]|nr:DUF2164 family protein [Pseudomonadota bacterium]HQR04232.1 DUF2164 family protein [Rhodocyclaceae bacterium]
MAKPSPITLNPQREQEVLLRLRALLRSEYDLDLGSFEVKALLDWFCAEIGTECYNQAVSDARKVLGQRISLIEDELWALEK